MRQPKDIQQFSEIEDKFTNVDSLGGTFNRLLKEFRLKAINNQLNLAKTKGLDGEKLFQVLFLLPFINILNIRSLYLSGFSKEVLGRKDAYYEFLNNPKINWRKIVTLFSKQFVKIADKKSLHDSEVQTPKCLIVDDSILEKSGKKIEFIGKVFDHCTHTYQLGMKLLTLGFWDGKSFIPLDFSIHNEPGKEKNRGLKPKELKEQFSKLRKDCTPGATRVLEVSKSKIEMALEMIKSALTNGFTPKYVLADSWFITSEFIKQVTSLKQKTKEKLEVIGLMKTNRVVILNGRKVKAELIPELRRKKIKNNRKFKCNYISETIEYKGTELKVFFVKMNGQTTWRLLITTDKSLSFSNAMKYYQIRWSIEVFFRDAKQNLNLGKCQSNDFDAHIASISISFMNFTLLALSKRFDAYETLGQMFIEIKNEILEDTLVTKLWKFFTEVFVEILSDLGIEWEHFIKNFLHTPELLNKIKLTFNFLFSADRSKHALAA
jgi:hypothetical protein